jgi:hypothetical protein
MPIFEVDVLMQTPTTRLVIAADEADASERALAGEGIDVSHVEYTYGEVVDVRAREVK